MIIVVTVSVFVAGLFFADDLLFFKNSGEPLIVFFSPDESDALLPAAYDDLETYDVVVGKGEVASWGCKLVVNYKGWTDKGEVLINPLSENILLSFTLGRGEVIEGWDEGLVGMREGGVRKLFIPPEFGYGKVGLKDNLGKVLIPPNTALVFEVALLNVSK